MATQVQARQRGSAGGSDMRSAVWRRPPFLYEHVTRSLRERIAGGLYPPGARIPTEPELVREFGVSPITVRRALRDLGRDGLVVGRQGLGVFVSSTRRIVRSLSDVSRHSIGDEMRRAGVQPQIEEISLAPRVAPDDVRRYLHLAPGRRTYLLVKRILGDGAPVALDCTDIPPGLLRRLGGTVGREFLFPLMRRRGIEVDHYDFQFEGGGASEEEASLLALPVGFPLLIVQYCGIAPSGEPIMFGRTYTRWDRFTWNLCARPPVHGSRAAAGGATR